MRRFILSLLSGWYVKQMLRDSTELPCDPEYLTDKELAYYDKVQELANKRKNKKKK